MQLINVHNLFIAYYKFMCKKYINRLDFFFAIYLVLKLSKECNSMSNQFKYSKYFNLYCKLLYTVMFVTSNSLNITKVSYFKFETIFKVVEDLMPTDLLDEYKQAFQILDRKNIGKISIRVCTFDCLYKLN